MNSRAPPAGKRLTLVTALADLGWIPLGLSVSVGGASIISIVEQLLLGYTLVPDLQWIIDLYNRGMRLIGLAIEPLLRPGLAWLNAHFHWQLIIDDIWRPLFAIGMVYVSAEARVHWHSLISPRAIGVLVVGTLVMLCAAIAASQDRNYAGFVFIIAVATISLVGWWARALLNVILGGRVFETARRALVWLAEQTQWLVAVPGVLLAHWEKMGDEKRNETVSATFVTLLYVGGTLFLLASEAMSFAPLPTTWEGLVALWRDALNTAGITSTVSVLNVQLRMEALGTAIVGALIFYVGLVLIYWGLRDEHRPDTRRGLTIIGGFVSAFVVVAADTAIKRGLLLY